MDANGSWRGMTILGLVIVGFLIMANAYAQSGQIQRKTTQAEEAECMRSWEAYYSEIQYYRAIVVQATGGQVGGTSSRRRPTAFEACDRAYELMLELLHLRDYAENIDYPLRLIKVWQERVESCQNTVSDPESQCDRRVALYCCKVRSPGYTRCLVLSDDAGPSVLRAIL
jgi:hypothetical protein